MIGSVLETLGRQLYRLAFEISPIILQGGVGVAVGVPGGFIPIVALTESLNFATGLLSGGGPLDLDNFFAHFRPLAGASMLRNRIGKYTFANQTVAANAIIADPLNVSLVMVCPAKGPGGYAVKLATMTALQATLQKHASLGGTYIVATPSLFYTDVILLGVTDVSGGDGKQPQEAWRFDFEKPLVTLQQATQVQNNLMSRLTNGTPTTGALSGPDVTPGFTPSGAAPATAPISSNLAGTSPATFLSTPLTP